MAITASTISSTQTLEEFRLEFNKLRSDVSSLESNPTYGTSITFEGATTDDYETTLTVTDPTADRTITFPNATGTVMLTDTVNPSSADGGTLGTSSLEWSDLYLADGGVIYFGDDQDVTLTHVADTGLLLNTTMAIQFYDSSQYINAPSATVLDINATDEIELNATLVDVNANLDVSGTYSGGGTMTTGGNIVIPDAGNIGSASDTDAIAIASTGVVTMNQIPVFSAGINVTGNVTASGTVEPAGDTAAGDNAAIGYTSAEGLILTGQGSTSDITIKNDADADVITVPTGTTNVVIAGDLTLSDASSVNISTPLLAATDHTYTGMTAEMLAGGTISAFDLVCIHTTTQEVVEADASTYATARVIGIAPAAISDTATGTVLLHGFIRDDTWAWTTGSTLYASETAGAMTHTPPSTDGAFVQVVGTALSPDVVYFNPSMDVIEHA